MPLWLLALATAALVLVAAKAHGRQVRLEREQQGVFAVDFRGRNPEVVERIWRTDRRIFWPAFAALAVFGAAAVLLLALSPSDLVGGFLATTAWAFAAAFLVAGLSSWARMARLKQGPLPWRRRATAGSVAWWLAAAAAAALVAWAV